MKKILSILMAICMIALLPSVTAFADGRKAVLLPNKVLEFSLGTDNYDSFQIASPQNNGIYFFNQGKLWLYNLSSGKYSLRYNFEGCVVSAHANSLYCCGDDKVYAYSLYKNKLVSSFNFKGVSNVSYAGEDRLLLFAYNADNGYMLYLVNNKGKIISKKSFDTCIQTFYGFDKTNGNIYADIITNWAYWGYDHSMHTVVAINVKNDKITTTKKGIMYTAQQFYYDRQRQAELIGGKYLCVDSTFETGFYVINSNKYKLGGDVSTILEIPKSSDSTFDRCKAVGTRTVSLGGNKIVTARTDNILAEYDMKTGKKTAEVKCKYPIFSLTKYNNEIIAIEKSGDKFYYERIPWTYGTKLTLTADKTTLNKGDSVQLKVKSNGGISTSYTWKSSNNSVAGVTSKGKVYAYNFGTAKITVSNAKGLKASVTIKVTSKSKAQTPSKPKINLSGTASNNVSSNNYSTYGSTVKSYLYENSDKTITRVEYINKNVKVENYTKAGKLKSSKTIKAELPIFGGFYSGKTYNFLVFGKSNPNESNKSEIMRIVKYSKGWKRLSAASVKGANTYIPFDAGSLRMDEYQDILYVHTCHEMYQSDDGYHHQANMTYCYNMKTNKIADSSYYVMNLAQAGYVSHSFNQFVKAEGGYVYRVDHGDAYPRGITITKSSVKGKITNVSYAIPITFKGTIGANTTHASIGGFELSDNKCIIAGNAIALNRDYSESNSIRNIFVSITPKTLGKSKLVRLTNIKDKKIKALTPQLVKLGNSEFLVMWEEYNSQKYTYTTKAVRIDENGNLISAVKKLNVRLSDCQPIVRSDGLVTWYTTNNKKPVMYLLNPYTLKPKK